jgi:hypothetical protein
MLSIQSNLKFLAFTIIMLVAALAAPRIAPAQELAVSNGVPSEVGNLVAVDGVATFDLIDSITIPRHEAVKNWSEGGMLFSCPGGIYASFSNPFIPRGLTDSHFYYDSGVFGRYSIRQADAEPFAALQFDVSDAGGSTWDYVWMTVLRDGQVLGDFNMDIRLLAMRPGPANRITIHGDFDQVLISNAPTSIERDWHDPDAGNGLVLDNVSFTNLPEPGSALALGGVIALLQARRRNRGSGTVRQ